MYKLLLIAVTFPVTSASFERSFSKMKLMKTFLKNYMSNDRLSNIALLSIESARPESINLENFVDKFDSGHDNRRINYTNILKSIWPNEWLSAQTKIRKCHIIAFLFAYYFVYLLFVLLLLNISF